MDLTIITHCVIKRLMDGHEVIKQPGSRNTASGSP